MKRYVFLFSLFLTTSVLGQNGVWGSDSLKCWESFNNFGMLYNAKNYAESYDHWLKVYTDCPRAKEIVFIYGPQVVRSKIEKTTDEVAKKKLVELLMQVYDKRNEYFPGKEAYVLGSKAYEYLQFYPEDPKGAHEMFKLAMAKGSTELTPSHLNGYFLSGIRLLKDKTIDVASLFTVYNQVNEALEHHTDRLNESVASLRILRDSGTLTAAQEKSLAKEEKLLEGFDKVAGNIEKSLAPVLNCERLALIYNEASFTANKSDIVWLKRAVKMLEKERKDEAGNTVDCTDNPSYLKVSEALYALQPSAQAARSMGRLSYKREKYTDAMKYYSDAVAQEVDPTKKSNDYLRLAATQMKLQSFAVAKQNCLKSMTLNKNNADPYFLLASIYAEGAGTCGSNAFEKNAVYWAAIEWASKAKLVDPSASMKADRLISVFRKGIPDKSISFQFNYKEGDRYTIGCWINETVTVRFYQ